MQGPCIARTSHRRWTRNRSAERTTRCSAGRSRRICTCTSGSRLRHWRDCTTTGTGRCRCRCDPAVCRSPLPTGGGDSSRCMPCSPCTCSTCIRLARFRCRTAGMCGGRYRRRRTHRTCAQGGGPGTARIPCICIGSNARCLPCTTPRRTRRVRRRRSLAHRARTGSTQHICKTRSATDRSTNSRRSASTNRWGREACTRPR